MAVLSNLADKKLKVLNEIKRVLKEDGFIIMSMYSENAFDERIKLYKKFNVPIKEIKGTTVIFDEETGDNISEQHSKEELIDLFRVKTFFCLKIMLKWDILAIKSSI